MKHNHYELDASNLLCPMPVIRTQNEIAKLQAGDQLKVICTDPGAVNDIPSWCRINGHEVLSIKEDHDNPSHVFITIKVGSG